MQVLISFQWTYETKLYKEYNNIQNTTKDMIPQPFPFIWS